MTPMLSSTVTNCSPPLSPRKRSVRPLPFPWLMAVEPSLALKVTVFAPAGIGEVGPATDLAAEILAAVAGHRCGPLVDGDIVVVTSKICSKAEGRSVPALSRLETVKLARRMMASLPCIITFVTDAQIHGFLSTNSRQKSVFVCSDSEVYEWDGKAWKAITPNWVVGDRALTRKLLEESSLAYAAEKKITPACMN